MFLFVFFSLDFHENHFSLFHNGVSWIPFVSLIVRFLAMSQGIKSNVFPLGEIRVAYLVLFVVGV